MDIRIRDEENRSTSNHDNAMGMLAVDTMTAVAPKYILKRGGMGAIDNFRFSEIVFSVFI